MFPEITVVGSPAFLFSVGKLSFYEHPELGDETSMLIKFADRWVSSGLYDAPDILEAEDIYNSLKGWYYPNG